MLLQLKGFVRLPEMSGRGHGPPAKGNEGKSAMRSRTGRFEAGDGTFGHEAWCGMLWLLTLSITTCSVWPSSQRVLDSPPSPQAGCFDSEASL